MYGLYTAALKVLDEDRFASTSSSSYLILKTVRKEDIGLDEIIVSLLTSSYVRDLGLNAEHAGKQTGGRGQPAPPHELIKSAQAIRDNGFLVRNMQDSKDKQSRLRRCIEALQTDEIASRQREKFSILKENKEKTQVLLEQGETLRWQLEINYLKQAWAKYLASRVYNNATAMRNLRLEAIRSPM